MSFKTISSSSSIAISASSSIRKLPGTSRTTSQPAASVQSTSIQITSRTTTTTVSSLSPSTASFISQISNSTIDPDTVFPIATESPFTSAPAVVSNTTELGPGKYVLIALGVFIPIVVGCCALARWRRRRMRRFREASNTAGGTDAEALPWVAAERRTGSARSSTQVMPAMRGPARSGSMVQLNDGIPWQTVPPVPGMVSVRGSISGVSGDQAGGAVTGIMRRPSLPLLSSTDEIYERRVQQELVPSVSSAASGAGGSASPSESARGLIQGGDIDPVRLKHKRDLFGTVSGNQE
ncbi:hypothetical protein BC830DRAFT_1091240 [Chytriomyces sp. MP71]|nr:hypothetical protein BC830DRAFT_1091240 [Chytriomyces sp. MP71]